MQEGRWSRVVQDDDVQVGPDRHVRRLGWRSAQTIVKHCHARNADGADTGIDLLELQVRNEAMKGRSPPGRISLPRLSALWSKTLRYARRSTNFDETSALLTDDLLRTGSRREQSENSVDSSHGRSL